MDEIAAEQVGGLLRGRMGLLIGPGITKFPRSLSDLSEKLASFGKIDPKDRYIDTCDELITNGIVENRYHCADSQYCRGTVLYHTPVASGQGPMERRS